MSARWCQARLKILALLLVTGLIAPLSPCAEAQQPQRPPAANRTATNAPAVPHAQVVERANQNTVTIISGTPAGTYLTIAYDMSVVLDKGDDLRVLAIAGRGSRQNVNDILHLRGVDMGIVQSDTLTLLKQTGELGASIDKRLVFITKLYNEEMHIVAGRGITRLEDLNGKKVNFSDAGSGTELTTRIVFDILGLKVEKVNMGQADGLVKVQSGEIAATVFIAGRPAAALARLAKNPDLRILPMPYPQALEDASYFPATLTSQDYPALIPEGETVETIAVGAVLAVYNWPQNTDRYRRVANFIDAFFGRFDEFHQAPRHPKWKEINLAAQLPGWQRFPAAQEWLDRFASQMQRGGGPVLDPALARQQAARAAPGNEGEQERLFLQFLEWSKSQRKQ